MTTPQHCPVFEQFKHLRSFICKCSHCGKEIEIFSDEFDRKHVCKGCGKEIAFTQSTLQGEA
jgi:DNA-directed RNA polymerase subunit RPC12/RpoP